MPIIPVNKDTERKSDHEKNILVGYFREQEIRFIDSGLILYE